MGVPNTRFLQAYNTKVQTEDKIPDWAANKIEMKGHGLPPGAQGSEAQKKLMAARAAELDAKRKLAEHVSGFQVSSQSTVKDFITEHDDIRSQVDAVLVGSMVEKTTYDGETAEVTVSLPGMQLWEVVHEWIRTTTKEK